MTLEPRQSSVTLDMIDKGAAALVKGGVVSDPTTGDALYDYDWTPIEAAEAVLRAAIDGVWPDR